MKELIVYLWYLLKQEIKTMRFYVIFVFFILVFLIMFGISSLKYDFNSHIQLINALATSFAITCFLVLLIWFGKHSFLKRIIKTKNIKNNEKINLNKIQKNSEKIKSDWTFFFSFLWNAIATIICFFLY
ncbi:hypothetical protein [Mycoplasmopsis cricetuli]|uniref:hypothetical protein n=1 Tax=Mycoplasmopsis cricetuli TaxID=171283 RepID=UPI0004729C02|nr:hypothetical protein [Mycoplasmopsis cricetuli]